MQISHRFLADTEEDAGAPKPLYLFAKEENRIVTFINRHDTFSHCPGKYTFQSRVLSRHLIASFSSAKAN